MLWLALGAVAVGVDAVVFWRREQMAQFFMPPDPKPVFEKPEVVRLASPGLLVVDPESSLRKIRSKSLPPRLKTCSIRCST